MKPVPTDATLTYTQMTVAFPGQQPHPGDTAAYDSVNVVLDAPDGGSYGEFGWYFYRFDSGRYEHLAAHLEVFGDGLPAFTDPRVQRVFVRWTEMADPDDLTPATLIEWLEAEGTVASEYHLRGKS